MTTTAPNDQTTFDLPLPSNPDTNIELLSTTPIRKALLSLSVPTAAGMIVGTVHSIINAAFVGHSGDTSLLAALTFSLPIMALIMALGGLFGVGASSFISRSLGEGNLNDARHASPLALWGPAALGLIMAIPGLIFITPLSHFLGADSSSVAPTVTYIAALLIGSPILMAVFSLEQVVRSEGFAKAAMTGMLISTGANIVFDAIFILGLHLGVLGAGIATVLANAFALAYFIAYISRKSQNLSLNPMNISFAPRIVTPIFVIGSSELVQSAFLFTSTLIINNLAIGYGNDFVAGIGTAQRIVQIPETLSMGIFFGALPLLAYTLGAGNIARTQQALRTSALWIAGLSGAIALVVFLFKDQVLTLVGGESLVNGGHMVLTAMLISSLFNGLTGLAIAWFQASGQGVAAIIMTAAQGVLLIPIMLFMNSTMGQPGLIWSLTVTEVITCAVALILFIVTGGVIGASSKHRKN